MIGYFCYKFSILLSIDLNRDRIKFWFFLCLQSCGAASRSVPHLASTRQCIATKRKAFAKSFL